MPVPQYVIQASPLSKLFMLGWTERCEDNPDIVYSSEPFDVIVPRTLGALKFTHNKPVHISKIEPPRGEREKDDGNSVDDLDGLVLWLVGGEDGNGMSESDIYGIVGLNIDMDLSSALSDVAFFDAENPEDKKKAAKKYVDVQQALLDQTKVAMTSARERADNRVRRAMKATHINLMRQYETLKVDGKGVYAPSVAEAVGAYVLRKEIEKSSINRRKMIDMLAATMQDTTVLK